MELASVFLADVWNFIILCSGLLSLSLEPLAPALSYHDIPHYPFSTIPGHEGRLLMGSLGSEHCVVLEGRAHLYQGFSAAEVGPKEMRSHCKCSLEDCLPYQDDETSRSQANHHHKCGWSCKQRLQGDIYSLHIFYIFVSTQFLLRLVTLSFWKIISIFLDFPGEVRWLGQTTRGKDQNSKLRQGPKTRQQGIYHPPNKQHTIVFLLW